MCALVLDELFAGAVRAQVAAGAVTHSEGDRAPHVELVVTGLVRVFVRSLEGRTVTVRYCRPSALLGVMSLYNDHFTMPAPSQALVDSSVLRMRPERAGALAVRDERVAQAWAEELSDRAVGFLREIAGYAFTTVRQRVARHVLDLAAANIGADRGQLASPKRAPSSPTSRTPVHGARLNLRSAPPTPARRRNRRLAVRLGAGIAATRNIAGAGHQHRFAGTS